MIESALPAFVRSTAAGWVAFVAAAFVGAASVALVAASVAVGAVVAAAVSWAHSADPHSVAVALLLAAELY